MSVHPEELAQTLQRRHRRRLRELRRLTEATRPIVECQLRRSLATGEVSRADLSRLRRELQEDQQAMRRREQDIADVVEAFDKRVNRAELALGALSVHDWYTALETSMERIARILDRSVPDGLRWHQDLLSQLMTELPGVRTSVLPPELREDLQEILRFRRFLRHAYDAELDPERLRDQMLRVRDLADEVRSGFQRFDRFLKQVIEDIRTAD